MATETWRPLSVRQGGNAAEYDALHEGVPPWLSPLLMTWIQSYLGTSRNVNDFAVRFVGLKLRLDLQDPFGRDLKRAHVSLLSQMHDNPGVFLDVIDLALQQTQGGKADLLEAFLHSAGSAWAVAPDERGLTRRVAPEIQAAVQAEVDEAGRAGEFLAQAWSYVYGRHPNPSEGYHSAVKAIEAAGISVVAPNDKTATLGRVIGELRANQGMFRSAFASSAEGVKVALDLADVIWKSHHDRHGTPDETAPISVSTEEAEAAVHAALLLVHWFRVGAVRRSSTP